MLWLERPLILLGHGIRAAGCADLAPMLLDLGLPVAASWQAKDLVDNGHPSFLGCTGIYGNRAANKALAASNQVLALGHRLCIWSTTEQWDASQQSVERVTENLSFRIRSLEPAKRPEWLAQCRKWNFDLPWLEEAHKSADHINSYEFTRALEPFLAEDEVIVTDMGAPLMSAHQILRLKPPQRLMTSGGLGEMGVALPAAVGACFAGAKHVLCLHADGGMMLNLQELQTIAHHKLPIKIIVYDNQGYLMLKHTQRNQGLVRSGVDAASGISMPDFRRLAQDFGLASADLRTPADFEKLIPQLFASKEPSLLVYHMDPEQPLVPKVAYQVVDGKTVSDTLDNMSPHYAP